jgi:hypothetical protein
MSEAFDRINDVHAQFGHAGYIKNLKVFRIASMVLQFTKVQVQWLVGRCGTYMKNRPNLLIDMVRDCSFRLHTLLFPVPYASWTFRPAPRQSSLYSQYTRFSPSLSQHNR